MAVDWWGFGYAAAVVFGGFLGYKRKGTVLVCLSTVIPLCLTCQCTFKLHYSCTGSLVSLMAGLFFGGISGYGAYRVSADPRDIWISLGEYKAPVSSSLITNNVVLHINTNPYCHFPLL